MKNPLNNVPLASKPSSAPFNRKQEVAKIAKLVDRVRKRVERLQKGAPYSPALQSAKQFMNMHGISSLGQTKWIKTAQEFAEYKSFLKKFENRSTSTVPGAKAARQKQIDALEEIMRNAGVDMSQYNVDDLLKRLNAVDIYAMKAELGVMSDGLVEGVARLMTKGERRVTAQKIFKEVFGGPSAKNLSKYNKGTKAHKTKPKKRKR